MKLVVGNILSLRASEKEQLEKLAAKKINSEELITQDLAKKIAQMSHHLGLQIGLLIGRDGQIIHLVVGTKDRLYLPDLGRFRLGSTRLRNIRLIVFLPDAEGKLLHQFSTSNPFSSLILKRQKVGVLAPEIAADFLTDLEKLRLDALLIIAVNFNGEPGAVSFACINPAQQQGINQHASQRKRQLSFLYAESLNDLDFDFLEFISELESLVVASSSKTFDTGKDKAILVGAYVSSAKDAQASMAELEELARTAGIEILDKVSQRRRSLDPKTVIGKGKIEELVLHCLDLGAELVIFDRELSPGQLRSIANLTELKVIDRSMLILDIFAQRAKSSEGKLQVELAQLKYSLPRLTESDSGLSRLSGGIGGRGPGETKLEIGRRRAKDKISDLEKRIQQISRQRELRRDRRQSRGVPVISIVGYTNAGKSTLLNALTKGDVFVENKLFATLDTSSRRMRFPNEKEVIFIDTVGFIRELPKELVAAFRATLEEVGEADILLHLVDASNPEFRKQIEVVDNTLSSLGFNDKPRILVFNKTDLLSEIEIQGLKNTYDAYVISAAKRQGLEELVSCLQKTLHQTFKGQDPGRFTEIESKIV